jgi:excisionase family DNA binding protein
MLTTQEVAEQLGVAYQTVMAWIYQGKFPGAKKEETPRGDYYLIPQSDVTGFEKPKRGRPANPPANGTGGKKGGKK